MYIVITENEEILLVFSVYYYIQIFDLLVKRSYLWINIDFEVMISLRFIYNLYFN